MTTSKNFIDRLISREDVLHILLEGFFHVYETEGAFIHFLSFFLGGGGGGRRKGGLCVRNFMCKRTKMTK